MKLLNKRFIILLTFMLGIILITLGSTLAFLSVRTQGKKETSVKLGSITFHYDEVSLEGISLIDALPMSDEQGKKQTNYFEFRITSEKIEDVTIPYEITARKKDLNNLIEDKNVKIYLTKVVNNEEQQLLFDTYNNVPSLTKNNHEEQVLYISHFDTGTSLEETFRLRLWIDENTNYSAIKDENKNLTYPMEGKEFRITINVYTDDSEGTVNGGGQVTPRPSAGLYTMDDELIEDWDQLVTRGLVESNLSNGKDIVEATLADHNIETGKLVLADTVTSVEDNAFKSCTSLGSIILTDNVTTIGTSSFEESGLVGIDLKSVSSIGSTAFQHITTLEYVKGGEVDSIGYHAFTACFALKNVEFDKADVQGGQFEYSTALDTLILHDGSIYGLSSAGGNFEHIYMTAGLVKGGNGGARLKTVYLGEDVSFDVSAGGAFSQSSVETAELYSTGIISSGAFNNCTELKTVVIGENTTEINPNAFSGCTKLDSLTFEDGVETIWNSAFEGTTSLKDITFPNSLRKIYTGAFRYSGVENLELNPGLQEIGRNAFAYTKIKGKLQFPSSITTIDDNSFGSCTNIEEINVPGSNLYVGQNAFNANTSLTKAVFTGTNVNVHYWAFGGDNNLEYVEFNDANIRSQAFNGLSKLTTLKMNSGIIQENSFGDCGLKTIELGNMQRIGSRSFENNDNLETVYIGNIEEIEYSTFYDLPSLTTVTFGNNNDLVKIGEYAFANNPMLTTINFGTNSKLKYVEKYAFTNTPYYTNLKNTNGYVAVADRVLIGVWNINNNYVVPNNIVGLGGLFIKDSDSLTSFTIPSTVTYITQEAFDELDNLNSVTFESTSNWYANDELINVTNSTTNATNLQNNYLYNNLEKR